MYYISVRAEFDAAHQLIEYKGKCSQLNGHHWVVEGCWARESVGTGGISLDLSKLKRALRKVCGEYDHSYLNDFTALGNPTAENIAAAIYTKMMAMYGRDYIYYIKVEETPGCSVTYCPSGGEQV